MVAVYLRYVPIPAILPHIVALPAIVSFAASELVWRDVAARYRLRRGEQLRAGAVPATADADGVQSAADRGV